MGYSDQGAECYDANAGQINDRIDVSGSDVSLALPGIYHVQYACTNAAGAKATVAVRKVLVRDTTCPTCTMKGSGSVTREASFPYVDAGASCSDSVDGALGVVTDNKVQVTTTGTYYVTYSATDKTGNTNSVSSLNASCVPQVRTVTIKDTLRPVIQIMDGGKVIHTSLATDRGLGNEANAALARLQNMK